MKWRGSEATPQPGKIKASSIKDFKTKNDFFKKRSELLISKKEFLTFNEIVFQWIISVKSTRNSVAEDFLIKRMSENAIAIDEGTKTPVLFKVTSSNGKDISLRSMAEGEFEVLLGNSANIEVISSTPMYLTDGAYILENVGVEAYRRWIDEALDELEYQEVLIRISK